MTSFIGRLVNAIGELTPWLSHGLASHASRGLDLAFGPPAWVYARAEAAVFGGWNG